MTQTETRSYLEEIADYVGLKLGGIYIVNTLVPREDGSRIIGPLSDARFEQKKGQYGLLMSQLSPEERRPIVAFRVEETVKSID